MGINIENGTTRSGSVEELLRNSRRHFAKNGGSEEFEFVLEPKAAQEGFTTRKEKRITRNVKAETLAEAEGIIGRGYPEHNIVSTRRL